MNARTPFPPRGRSSVFLLLTVALLACAARSAAAQSAPPGGGRTPSQFIDMWIGEFRSDAGSPRIMFVWAPKGGPGPGVASAARVRVTALTGAKTVFAGEAGPVASLSFDAPPGQIAIVVEPLDASGKALEAVRQALVLTDYASKPLALSAPRFFVARTDGDRQRFDAESSPSPWPSSDFTRSQKNVLVHFAIYGAAASTAIANTTATLLRQDASPPVTLAVTRSAAPGALFPYVVDVNVGALDPGNYLLRIDVRNGSASATEETMIHVVP